MTADPLNLALPTEFVELVSARVAEILSGGAIGSAADDGWPEWMSVETAARYLDVPVERVRKLQARRDLPFYQDGPGCRVFFNRSELDEWMRGQRVAARQ